MRARNQALDVMPLVAGTYAKTPHEEQTSPRPSIRDAGLKEDETGQSNDTNPRLHYHNAGQMQHDTTARHGL